MGGSSSVDLPATVSQHKELREGKSELNTEIPTVFLTESSIGDRHGADMPVFSDTVTFGILDVS